jgi:hypothetical protein
MTMIWHKYIILSVDDERNNSCSIICLSQSFVIGVQVASKIALQMAQITGEPLKDCCGVL